MKSLQATKERILYVQNVLKAVKIRGIHYIIIDYCFCIKKKGHCLVQKSFKILLEWWSQIMIEKKNFYQHFKL